jgi:Fe-S-cluster containining protein
MVSIPLLGRGAVEAADLFNSANIWFREMLNGGIGSCLVAENPWKTLGSEPSEAGGTYNCSTEFIDFELDIMGRKVSFHIDVSQERARLADVVPLARGISKKVTDVVVTNTNGNGGRIPCRKGCSACCARYLVPLSVPEAFRLKEEIAEEPRPRRESIFRACLLTTERILSKRPPTQFTERTTKSSLVGPIDLNLVSNWYKNLKLPCPFLHKGLCTIYDKRPLACREHFVKGSAGACRGGRGNAEVVRLPVQMPNALAQLAGELEGTGDEAVILPLTLFWCEQNRQRANRTWPAVMMVSRFLEIVKAIALKNSIPIIEFKKTTTAKTHEQVISF